MTIVMQWHFWHNQGVPKLEWYNNLPLTPYANMDITHEQF